MRTSTDSSVLQGRYRLGRVLGSGGMATVHEGRDLVLDRPVAVKLLAPGLAADPSFVERFRNEAMATAQLSHPNIVTVFDAGTDRSSPYLVMELVPGRTLADLLRTEGPMSAGRAARIAADIADALATAHAKGIVHRDVKPGNVLVAPGGLVKVADFGIARMVGRGSLTRIGTLLGTPSYLSPEQLQGAPADERSDVYALGCVLYEMLTGRPPHAGDTPTIVAAGHLRTDPPAPSLLASGIPAALDDVVGRAIAKDPKERFAGAADLAGALRRLVPAADAAGPPPVPSPATAPTRVLGRAAAAATRESTRVLTRAGAAATRTLRRSPTLSGPTRAPRRRPGRRRTIAAIVVACVAVAAVLAFAVLGSGAPNPGARHAGAARTPPPSSSPTPSPHASTPAMLSVTQAYDRYVSTVQSAQQSRQIDPPIANALLHGGRDAMAAYDAGQLADALAIVTGLSRQVSDLQATNDIPPATAAAIRQALAALGRAMRAAPSPPPGAKPPGPGPGGPGHGGPGGPGDGDGGPGGQGG